MNFIKSTSFVFYYRYGFVILYMKYRPSSFLFIRTKYSSLIITVVMNYTVLSYYKMVESFAKCTKLKLVDIKSVEVYLNVQ